MDLFKQWLYVLRFCLVLPPIPNAHHAEPEKELKIAPVQGPIIGPTIGETNDTNGILGDLQDDGLRQEPGSAPSSPYAAERNALRVITQNSFMAASIPSSPPGSPDPAANAKVARFLKLKGKGVHFNADLAGKSSFQNPGLFSSMLGRAGLREEEQYASTLPRDVWHASIFPDWAYKEGLLQQQRDMNQKREADRKSQSSAGKRTIEWVGEDQPNVSSRSSTPTKRKRP